MKKIFVSLLFAAISSAGCVSTPQPAPRPWSGTWDYLGSRDYETQHAGLGVSYRFRSEIGWVDVYVYGLQRDDWADGVADPSFDRHFESVIDEVRMAERRGIYRDVKLDPAQDVEIGDGVFRHVAMRYLNEGKPVESHVYLAGVNGQLLKFRMSFFAPPPSNLDAVMRDFVARHIPRQTPGPIRRL